MSAYAKKFVSILTVMSMKRRLGGFAVLLAMPALAMTAEPDYPAWQPIAEITAAAENYLRQAAGQDPGHLAPAAGYLDPRLRLPRCTTPLEASTGPGSKLSGRVVVGIRCTGAKPWKIYLPVHVAVMQNVLIARNSMPRGHLIGPDDVELARRDVSGLVGGYLSQTGDAAGHRLKRAVAQGVVITVPLLQADVLIKRGQTVTLTARNHSINISMSGKALMDGAANQRIRVENTGSGRVVEGLVRSAEQVEVLVH